MLCWLRSLLAVHSPITTQSKVSPGQWIPGQLLSFYGRQNLFNSSLFLLIIHCLHILALPPLFLMRHVKYIIKNTSIFNSFLPRRHPVKTGRMSGTGTPPVSMLIGWWSRWKDTFLNSLTGRKALATTNARCAGTVNMVHLTRNFYFTWKMDFLRDLYYHHSQAW